MNLVFVWGTEMYNCDWSPFSRVSRYAGLHFGGSPHSHSVHCTVASYVRGTGAVNSTRKQDERAGKTTAAVQ